MNQRATGLYAKFNVSRRDGQDRGSGKHRECQLFVLDLSHDLHALPAIRAYIESCRADFPELAKDLTGVADDIEAMRRVATNTWAALADIERVIQQTTLGRLSKDTAVEEISTTATAALQHALKFRRERDGTLKP